MADGAGIGSILSREGENQGVTHGRRDDHAVGLDSGGPTPRGIVKGLAGGGVERDEARARVALPTGGLCGSMAVGIAIRGVTATAGTAHLRGAAVVLHGLARLLGLDGVAEEFAVVGIAAVHGVIGDTAIDEVSALGQNERAHGALPCGSSVVEVLPFVIDEVRMEAEGAVDVGVVSEVDDISDIGLDGVLHGFRVGLVLAEGGG